MRIKTKHFFFFKIILYNEYIIHPYPLIVIILYLYFNLLRAHVETIPFSP